MEESEQLYLELKEINIRVRWNIAIYSVVLGLLVKDLFF